jgi:putative transposase
MDDYESLSHSKWGVQIPRRVYSEVSQEGVVCRVAPTSGRCLPEIGRAKGKSGRGRSSSARSRAYVDLDSSESREKSAIHLARVYGEKKRNFVGQHFCARGYFVSTVGRDTEVIREYIRKQEDEDKRLDQMNLWR